MIDPSVPQAAPYGVFLWTPTLTMGTLQGSATVTLPGSSIGYVTKVGQLYFFTGYIRVTKGTGTGTFSIGGLPNTFNTGAYSQVNIIMVSGVTVPASHLGLGAYMNSGTFTLTFPSTAGASNQDAINTDFAATVDLIMSGFYVGTL